jgi:phage gpG-like protein
MLNVQVKIFGDKETIAKLNKLDKSFSSWKPELQQVGDFLKAFYQSAVFETEGGVFGARWAALNPSYEFYKRKKWAGRGILVRSGDLQKGYEMKVADTYVELKNVMDYAIYHQTGTSKMPQRLLVRLDNDRKNEIINIFKRGLAGRIKKAL